MEWKPLDLSEQDKAFLEYMEQAQREIVGAFSIPSYMLGTVGEKPEVLLADKMLHEMDLELHRKIKEGI